MGNYQFGVSQNMHPKKGDIVLIKDSQFTASKKYPKEILYQGSKAQVIGTKNLMKSRSNAPDVSCSMIKLQNGKIDVYFTNNVV